MNVTINYVDASGQTLYAYPLNQSLANWSTYRIAMTESASPDRGLYQCTVDTASGYNYGLFTGTGQPASWNSTISSVLDVMPSVNIEEMNKAELLGSGTSTNKWRGE